VEVDAERLELLPHPARAGAQAQPALAEDALDTLVRLDALRREAGRADAPFETVVPLVTPPDLDTLRRLEDAGASGAVSYPFAFSVAPSSSLDQKRAYLESYANDVIEKLRRGARGPGR
jgi:hypothetical protein